MGLPATLGTLDREELRLAVTMVGGSSLSVYMGGTALEMSRLVRASRQQAAGPTYRELLDLVHATAQIDVISGTSAGGLNGACLALALARGTSLDQVRQLWLRHGDFAKLLRSVSESSPPSLLQGDAYFLPRLREAFAQLADASDDSPAGTDPIDLRMTVTSVDGEVVRFRDDFDTPIDVTEHQFFCRFTRPASLPTAVFQDVAWQARLQPPRDDFADPRIADQLALAARSSASFPLAFEPSYLPVGGDGDASHPDMRDKLVLPDGVPIGRSGFVLDGGVLMNLPLKPTIETVFAMPAERQVRRVLAFVVPDPARPPTPAVPSPWPPPDPPSPGSVLIDTLVTLPRNESVAQELRELEAHNRRVRSVRRQRLDVVDLLQPDRGAWDDKAARSRLAEVTGWLFPEYTRLRRQETVDRIADEVVVALEARGGLPGARERAFLLATIRQAIEEAAAVWQLDPARPPDGSLVTGGQWRWGIATVERLGATVLDLLQRTVWLLGSPGGDTHEIDAAGDRDAERPQMDRLEPLAAVQQLRTELHLQLAMLRVLRALDQGFWAGRVPDLQQLLDPAAGGDPSAVGQRVAGWARRSVEDWPGPDIDVGAVAGAREPAGTHADRFLTQLRDRALAISGMLLRLGSILAAYAGEDVEHQLAALAGPHSRLRASQVADARRALRLLHLLTGVGDRDGVLMQLLRLEVVQNTVAGAPDAVEQPIDFVMLTAETPAAFGEVPSGVEKLAGKKLGHFGAFYKHTWRANDWMWGRLDGAYRLVEITLSPARLLQLGYDGETAFERIKQIAVQGADDVDREELERRWEDEEPSLRRELQFLDERSLPVPARLEHAGAAVARRLQLEILRAELPHIAAAVTDDELARTAPSSRAKLVERQVRNFGADLSRVPAGPLVALLRDAQVGRDEFADEVGTDGLTALASHAGMVASGTLVTAGGPRGPRFLKRPIQLVRGSMLAFYALAIAAVRGSRTGFAVVALLLATGAASLTAGVLAGEEAPEGVMFFGTVVVAGGALLVLLRAGVLYLAVVVAGAAGLYGVLRWWLLASLDPRPGTTLGNLLAIGVIVAGAIVAGAIGIPGWLTRQSRIYARLRRSVDDLVDYFDRTGVAVWTLVISGSALLLFWLVIWATDRCSPGGIVGFQFAAIPEQAAPFIADWRAENLLDAAHCQLWTDFQFPVAYAFFLMSACLLAARFLHRLGWRDGAGFGRSLALAVWVAALLDVAENILLLRVLASVPDGARRAGAIADAIPGGLTAGAAVAAAAKWAIVVTVIGYLVIVLARVAGGGVQVLAEWVRVRLAR